MAELPDDARRKAELIAQLDEARRNMRAMGGGLRKDADVPSHIKQSLKGHKITWILGAAGVSGLLLGMLFLRGRKKKTKKKEVLAAHYRESPEERVVKAGILFSIVKFAFSVMEPVFKNVLRKYVTEHFVHGNGYSGRRR